MKEVNAAEDQLRAEIEDLKRQLAEQKNLHDGGEYSHSGPSAVTLVMIALVLLGLIAVGFVAGYLPRQKREQVLAAESRDSVKALPVVTFSLAERSSGKTELVLPGTIQAVTEAPILARATGYIRKRTVDIGDRVKTGAVLAEVEAP